MLLPEHRRRPKGLADLLPWGALVADGVTVNKDGSLLAGFAYRGPDVDSATDEELSALARHLNQAFLPLGGDWMLHVDAVRSPAAGYPPPGAFPDPVTAAIDEERRRQYSRAHGNFETRYVLTVTHMPPPETHAKAMGWFIEGAEERAFDYREHLRLFERRLDDFEDLLSARLEIDRLDSEALAAHLHLCVTGLDHKVRLTDPPCYLDVLLASQDFSGGFAPRIGRHHIAPIGITGFPLHSLPGMLDFLNRLALPYRFSSRWLPLDPETATKHIRRYRRKWWQKRRGLSGLLSDVLRPQAAPKQQRFANRDAVRMAEDADEAMAEAASHQVAYGYYTPVLVLMSEDTRDLQEATRQVLRELRNHGFSARLEEVNAIEAYLGTLPGHGYPNVRRPLVSTRNLADLLPATSVWAGLATNPCPFFPDSSPALLWAATSGSTPFRLNLHVSDVGHTLVIGPTGSGKSTLLGLIEAQWFRYEDAQVFVFDKGYSAMPLTKAAGGDHYAIAGERDEDLSFYPLAGIDDPRERAWAAEWLEVLFDLLGLEIAPRERTAIHDALELLAASPSRTLTDLEIRLQSESLREAIRPYTLNGTLGSLLDAESDGLSENRFSVFEMSHLMELKEKVVVPVLLYLFHRIEQRLDGRPTLLVIDEAWTFLMHGLFAERIQTWLKELRKKNASVVFSTQSLADIHRSEKRYVIYESCPTKIFLPNPEAVTDHVRELYREIGLNAREIETVASAVPKRDYYYTAIHGRRLIDLTLGPLALSFVGASDKDSLRRIAQLEQNHSGAWPVAWLEERGLERWAAELLERRPT
ncbi:MAG: transporter [bacterium]|nr:transporter [bacterium]